MPWMSLPPRQGTGRSSAASVTAPSGTAATYAVTRASTAPRALMSAPCAARVSRAATRCRRTCAPNTIAPSTRCRSCVSCSRRHTVWVYGRRPTRAAVRKWKVRKWRDGHTPLAKRAMFDSVFFVTDNLKYVLTPVWNFWRFYLENHR